MMTTEILFTPWALTTHFPVKLSIPPTSQYNYFVISLNQYSMLTLRLCKCYSQLSHEQTNNCVSFLYKFVSLQTIILFPYFFLFSVNLILIQLQILCLLSKPFFKIFRWSDILPICYSWRNLSKGPLIHSHQNQFHSRPGVELLSWDPPSTSSYVFPLPLLCVRPPSLSGVPWLPSHWFIPTLGWSLPSSSFLRKEMWEINCLNIASHKTSILHSHTWFIDWLCIKFQVGTMFSSNSKGISPLSSNIQYSC